MMKTELPANNPVGAGEFGFTKKVKRVLKFAYRYTVSYFEKGRFTSPAIPRLSIETTNICNAKCVFCANPVMERRKEPIEMVKFKKAVDELVALGGSVIDFNVTIGDPLLDPNLLERARYVKQFPQFKTLGFVTTLQWLHRYDLDEFFESGITWLSISTSLSGREKYFEFFGVDKYEPMLTNLITLIKENDRRGRPLELFIGVKPTNEPLESVLQHADFKLINSMVEQDLESAVDGQGTYVDDWQGAVDLPPYLKKRPLYPRAFRPCQLLYSGLMVYSNGNVGACACRDFEASSELILGNVGDQTLGEMWNGSKLAGIRSDWLTKNKVPDICKSCRHYLY
jgi:radical SAM protein with 4Fe4S-binding SPASM domain